jgi:AAHS family 4-hydroxybenzoate transporter-like MFS transporter
MTGIKTLIDQSPISRQQILVIVLCLLMNMLDGMDVLVISYAAPVLAKQWGIAPEALGVVFSAALLGMSAGALLLSPVADKIGRRKMILLCIVIMTIGILLTAVSQTIWQLGVLRFFSGLGIGGMLASTATLAAEYAPERRKNIFVSIVMSGYAIGATLFGVVAAHVIPAFGWRALFIVAGLTSLVTFPLVFAFMTESMDWLVKKQPKGALEKLNTILHKMRLPEIDALPEPGAEAHRNPLKALFEDGRSPLTIQLWVAFFLAFATLYFLTAWIPNLASAMGLPVDLAIYAGTVFNLGAAIGIWLQGWLSQYIGLKRAIIGFLLGTAVLMGVFGFLETGPVILTSLGLIGFGMQGGFIGMYTVAARVYPTEMRNTGVGGAIGAGRTGAIVSPVLAGVLVGIGLTPAQNFIAFAVPLLVVCVLIAYLRSKAI